MTPDVKLGVDALWEVSVDARYQRLEDLLHIKNPCPDLTLVQTKTEEVLAPDFQLYKDGNWRFATYGLGKAWRAGKMLNDLATKHKLHENPQVQATMESILKATCRFAATRERRAVDTEDPEEKRELQDQSSDAIESVQQWARNFDLQEYALKSINNMVVSGWFRVIQMPPEQSQEAIKVLASLTLSLGSVLDKAQNSLLPDTQDLQARQRLLGLIADYVGNLGVLETTRFEIIARRKNPSVNDMDSAFKSLQKAQSFLAQVLDHRLPSIVDKESDEYKEREARTLSNTAYLFLLLAEYNMAQEAPNMANIYKAFRCFNNYMQPAIGIFTDRSVIKEKYQIETYCRLTRAAMIGIRAREEEITLYDEYLTEEKKLFWEIQAFDKLLVIPFFPMTTSIADTCRKMLAKVKNLPMEGEDDKILFKRTEAMFDSLKVTSN